MHNIVFKYNVTACYQEN